MHLIVALRCEIRGIVIAARGDNSLERSGIPAEEFIGRLASKLRKPRPGCVRGSSRIKSRGTETNAPLWIPETPKRRTRLRDEIDNEETQKADSVGAAKREPRNRGIGNVGGNTGQGGIRRGERVAVSGRARIPSRRDRVA